MNSLSVFEISWKEIFMNFIINLSSNKRKNLVYNAIFMIIDKGIKMLKYLLMIIKIDVARLTKLFFEKIILCFDISADILNNKISLFINIFWLTFCYYAKFKGRLNTVFYF